jgi:hypothetical protein
MLQVFAQFHSGAKAAGIQVTTEVAGAKADRDRGPRSGGSAGHSGGGGTSSTSSGGSSSSSTTCSTSSSSSCGGGGGSGRREEDSGGGRVVHAELLRGLESVPMGPRDINTLAMVVRSSVCVSGGGGGAGVDGSTNGSRSAGHARSRSDGYGGGGRGGGGGVGGGGARFSFGAGGVVAVNAPHREGRGEPTWDADTTGATSTSSDANHANGGPPANPYDRHAFLTFDRFAAFVAHMARRDPRALQKLLAFCGVSTTLQHLTQADLQADLKVSEDGRRTGSSSSRRRRGSSFSSSSVAVSSSQVVPLTRSRLDGLRRQAARLVKSTSATLSAEDRARLPSSDLWKWTDAVGGSS